MRSDDLLTDKKVPSFVVVYWSGFHRSRSRHRERKLEID